MQRFDINAAAGFAAALGLTIWATTMLFAVTAVPSMHAAASIVA